MYRQCTRKDRRKSTSCKLPLSAYITLIAQYRSGSIVSSPGTGWCRTGAYSKSIICPHTIDNIDNSFLFLLLVSDGQDRVPTYKEQPDSTDEMAPHKVHCAVYWGHCVVWKRESEAKPPALYTYSARDEYELILPPFHNMCTPS